MTSPDNSIGAVGGLRDLLAPLRVADLRMFFAGQAVSLLGTWMQGCSARSGCAPGCRARC